MARFEYTARKNGKTVSGAIEASSKDAVISTLHRQGMQPLTIKAVSSKKVRRKGKVKSKDLVVFTRQLSTMISAGVPLTRSLATLQNQTTNKYFHEVIGNVNKD